MKKKFLILILFTFCCKYVFTQPFNNEWIDYSKTYYKFKVGATGLYRINQTDLPSALATTPAQNFQLWRNGKQITIYTSVANGSLPNNGYLEFWGEQNNGIPDKVLYKNPTYQQSDVLSLQTDTAAYFLTANNNSVQNLRYTDGVNNIAGNTLSPEPYFTYTKRFDFKEQITRGYSVYGGPSVRLFTSDYDIGEGWRTRDINFQTPYSIIFQNAYPYNNGNINFEIGVFDMSDNLTKVSTKLNNIKLVDSQLIYPQEAKNFTATSSVSSLLAGSNVINIENNSADVFNRIAASFISITYPRLFNFGNEKNFSFSLPASTNAQGNYIEITNFNSSTTPVLYDITNNIRYIAVVNSGVVKFALPFSATNRNFVLVSADASNITALNSFQIKTFTNFSLANNQGNYLIISNKLLGINTGESVDLYRQYRASTTGGSFNAKIYDIEELTDQFAFGIKKHPLSIKNFVRFAKQNFTTNPSHIFLIGKGVAYDEYRYNENSAFADKLNLVPTFGWPASDALLVSEGVNVAPLFTNGRLSAVTPTEVNIYLQKVKEYEQRFNSTLQTTDNKLWEKQLVHVAGTGDISNLPLFRSYLKGYENIAVDTLLGGTVANFNLIDKPQGVTPEVVQEMKNYFASGISLLTYFGHSAATTLDYNLNDPNDYPNNAGKYPVYLLNGCNAGNFFEYDTTRLHLISSFSEKFVLAQQKGSIATIASTHFGLTGYLNSFSTLFYQSACKTNYKNYLGKNMIDGIANFSSSDFYARMHAEQFNLHGDPVLKIFAHDKPDFVVEEQNVSITPAVLSVADVKFTVKAKLYNIGKAQAARVLGGGDSVQVTIKWQHGDGSTDYLYRKFIKPSIRYGDSIVLDVPIVPLRDKGNNCLTISIDSLNQYDELSETNNSINKCFFIVDNDIRPVYPYNYSIINNSTAKLYASTANPIAASLVYLMEMDTTELFNSTFKISKQVTSTGGVIEFNPQITYADSTVYYWRVAVANATGINNWNKSSFMYLNGTEIGYNQSHLYQHLKSSTERMKLDSFSRQWNYGLINNIFSITQGVYPYTDQDADFIVRKNGTSIVESGCLDHSYRWTLLDATTLKPYYNQAIPSTDSTGVSGGFMNSQTPSACDKKGRQFNFEFRYNSLTERNQMRDFLNWIPTGVIAIGRSTLDQPFDTNPVSLLKADSIPNGTLANTLYGVLKANGFADIDSFNYARPWIFVFKKSTPSFTPKWDFGYNVQDVASLDIQLASNDTLGYITSPILGPAKAWKTLKWRGKSLETNNVDVPLINIIGINNAGAETTLFTNINLTQQDFNISSISAANYPYLKLKMSNKDATNYSPYQLRYWRLIADMLPEGALARNINYNYKDTLQVGEKLNFSIAFKNVSNVSFTDSLPVKIQLTNASGFVNTLTIPKLKNPLLSGDTATISTTIDTKDYAGNNIIYLDVNPNSVVAEQTHVNNFLYNNFYVISDNQKPILDVTFDGVHILNGDIVSSKPAIRVKLKDESKYMMLNDTAGIYIQLRYPDNSIKRFKYGTDTLKYYPPTNPSIDNSAIAEFTPVLTQDGEYELTVNGKDRSGNTTSNNNYTVTFNINNKPMISEVFNYPNPFTTSTAFVFTLTGNKIPSNIRIQILTITGKIVKEINKDELGPLHIGRNITAYKWDGTDMYGQKLANGVYLYRIISNLDGNSLDKYELKDTYGDKIPVDKYFKGGYGKMYLMR